MFTAIQTVEVSVRTKIIKHFALGFGAFWFMDGSHAINEARFTTNLAIIRKEVERSHDDFITEHFRKYSEMKARRQLICSISVTIDFVLTRILIYKTFEELATRGKYSMGWFFGFKLHPIINDKGEIQNFMFTPANVNDREPYCS